MVFLSFVVVAASLSSVVLGMAALGGFAGLAALAKVVVDWRRDLAQERVDAKSVAITELEKAVPGLSEIIEQWQIVVHQLQTDLTLTRAELATTRSDLDLCRKELNELRNRP